MIRIRFADKNDTGLIVEISRKTFYESFAAQNTPENMEMHMAQYYSPENIAAELIDPANIFLLAYDGDQPVGYAKMNEHAKAESKDLEDPIEIERIYSIREMLGKGVGKKLMEKCMAIANERGKKTVWLGVWESNYRAVEFYTRWGFEKFGNHNFPVGLDPQTDWLMKKTITSL
jgi:diamine N-acetyltransferase